MKKLNIWCFLIDHNWDKDLEVNTIVRCTRCNCEKKVIRIDVGGFGGQEAILEDIEIITRGN